MDAQHGRYAADLFAMVQCVGILDTLASDLRHRAVGYCRGVRGRTRSLLVLS